MKKKVFIILLLSFFTTLAFSSNKISNSQWEELKMGNLEIIIDPAFNTYLNLFSKENTKTSIKKDFETSYVSEFLIKLTLISEMAFYQYNSKNLDTKKIDYKYISKDIEKMDKKSFFKIIKVLTFEEEPDLKNLVINKFTIEQYLYILSVIKVCAYIDTEDLLKYLLLHYV